MSLTILAEGKDKRISGEFVFAESTPCYRTIKFVDLVGGYGPAGYAHGPNTHHKYLYIPHVLFLLRRTQFDGAIFQASFLSKSIREGARPLISGLPNSYGGMCVHARKIGDAMVERHNSTMKMLHRWTNIEEAISFYWQSEFEFDSRNAVMFDYWEKNIGPHNIAEHFIEESWGGASYRPMENIVNKYHIGNFYDDETERLMEDLVPDNYVRMLRGEGWV